MVKGVNRSQKTTSDKKAIKSDSQSERKMIVGSALASQATHNGRIASQSTTFGVSLKGRATYLSKKNDKQRTMEKLFKKHHATITANKKK